ncbi:hypothetical protein DPMN_078253 [Dreissena polymorpha]|uniref:Homeobox domain-containing protein n=1 Tax=Dreissena polymorpha TaxID=45954 RepID=A0A9D3YLX6_DREPO|nr:hypothetical protein DPMN_078253 [Dreissena polymorpha]
MKLTYTRTSGKTGQRRERTTFTCEQLDALEAVFSVTRYPDVQVRVRLAIKLGLSGDNILIWFKNRRAKTRNTDSNDVGETSPNFFPADTRTTGTDKGRNLTSNIRLAKKNTRDDDDDDVCKIMPKQRNKRLRCVDVEVSDCLAWMPNRTSTPVSCKTEDCDSSATLSSSETDDVSFTKHYPNDAYVNEQSVTSFGNNIIYNKLRLVGDAVTFEQYQLGQNLKSDAMSTMAYFPNSEYFAQYNHACIPSAGDSCLICRAIVGINPEVIVPTPYTKELTYTEL